MMDYAAAYRRDRHAIDAAIQAVLERGYPIMGPDVRAFEREFAAYCGAGYAAGVMSGSSALLLALRALRIGPGDEVITVANSDIPTSHAVTHAGATIVWVDIDPDTYNMAPGLIEAAITSRTRAIMPVHLYGIPAEMAPILDVAGRNALLVVEDACLAAGAIYRAKRVGSLGTIAAFSTAPGKMLGGLGSGGVITTSRPDLHERLKSLRNYGRARSPYPEDHPAGPKSASPTVEIGYNERLDTVDAAVLRIRLARLDDDVRCRRAIAATYGRLLAPAGIRVPRPPAGADPSWHVYPVRIPDRDRVYADLHRRGYETALRYLPANHLDDCYRSLGYREGALPETEAACREVLCLPCHPFMSPADAEELSGALLKTL
jgi:dTDP-4-amino-4,6-dideoxygalactose transaminase